MRETVNIKISGGIEYICISELPAEEKEPFRKWLTEEGQTCPVIEEEPIEFDTVYPRDYQLWKSNPNATYLL